MPESGRWSEEKCRTGTGTGAGTGAGTGTAGKVEPGRSIEGKRNIKANEDERFSRMSRRGERGERWGCERGGKERRGSRNAGG